ncbi:hypothetical protein MAR_019938 [Mya arenaria]|uniref:PiggyBac transposable element-derived protein domain-containing protein n=1 Tax=Mya arenaria TaxID=6604 RepID=A0ABY7E5Y2_MYAAR|nr:hypothetical protein MAR_019938 [Mya arenaria]
MLLHNQVAVDEASLADFSALDSLKNSRSQGMFGSRGCSRSIRKDAVMGTVWKDKRLVYHLSTLSQPADINDAMRAVLGNHLELQQQHTVYTYNKFMGGLDLNDQKYAK